jgi:hypothetical protein
MRSKIKSIFIIAILLLSTFIVTAQARLTIENNSGRVMTVKVMKGYSGKGTLYETVTITGYDRETIFFSESGTYFTKTKAVLKGKDPVYRKGQSFSVKNDDTGYSVLTLTFTIKESAVPQASGGKAISKSEFDQN